MPPVRLTDEQAKRLIDAAVAFKAATLERDAAIVEALKAGATTREVAAVVDMSHSNVGNIGRKNGWPTPEQLAAKEAEAANRAKWDQWLAEGLSKLDDEGT